MTGMRHRIIVVWFSCGAASAVAAKLTLEKYGKTHDVWIVNTPIKEEHEDNQRFRRDVEKWLGVKIEDAINQDFPNSSIVEVFDKRKYMSGVNGAPCTMLLKKEARYQYELSTDITYHVLGFTKGEESRHERFIKYERSNTLPVLIESGLTKGDCYQIIIDAGLTLPKIYMMGFPNANCIGCVKSTSPTYWNKVRKLFPETFTERASQSRDIGCKLVRYKGKRIFLDELPEDARGGRMKSFDCGIFCDNY